MFKSDSRQLGGLRGEWVSYPLMRYEKTSVDV